MTAYASVPAYVDHKLHPRLLLLIVAGHAAVIAAALMIKTDLPRRILPGPIVVRWIPAPTPPPTHPIQSHPKTQPQQQVRSSIDHPQQIVQSHENQTPQVDTTVPVQNFGEFHPTPLPPLPPSQPLRTGPRFATAPSELRPPYPEQKLLAQEEATLQLRLTIDSAGRVTAVDPVGSADPAFLAAARRHILAHWRYQPATEGGHPVPSSTVITLRFQLDR
jgi:periplasmic protein TonB